jgi:hypothetical protein
VILVEHPTTDGIPGRDLLLPGSFTSRSGLSTNLCLVAA